MGGLERKNFDCCESHAPIKTKRVRSGNVPWITSDLRERMRDRDVAKRKAIKSNDPHDWAEKSTKTSYYANAFIRTNGDSRKTWQMINDLTSRQKNNFCERIKTKRELSNQFSRGFQCI